MWNLTDIKAFIIKWKFFIAVALQPLRNPLPENEDERGDRKEGKRAAEMKALRIWVWG